MWRINDDEYTFEWDSGNFLKNEIKHGVSAPEAESIFADSDKFFAEDTNHSLLEKRYICIGKSEKGRLLTCAFTIRDERIRIISIRPANKSERHAYESQR